MAYVSGFDRTQNALFHMTVDEMIDENNVVRLLEIFINGRDLKKLSFEKVVPNEEGRPCYDPADLLNLVYNFVRALGILGFSGLKKRLERCFLTNSALRRTIEGSNTIGIFST